MHQKMKIFLILIVLATYFVPQAASAAKKKGGRAAFAGGSIAAGFGIGYGSAKQDGLNTMIGVAKNTTAASTSNFGSTLEFMAHLTFRFANNMVGLQLRPTFFSQSTLGSASDGSYDYELTGFTVFPLVRFIPLSNDIIDFYLQAGLGYGSLNGSVSNGPRKMSFKGSNFGMQVGLGADFCFIPEHCFGIEGDYRYLPIERNIVNSSSGGLPYGSSQATADRELEDLNGSDVGTSMTGIMGLLTYSYNF